jgi:urocanate hydratase
MYIGPQGIVHGTTITVLNAGRIISKHGENLAGKLFVTSGLGGMSGAQPKAGNIAGCITVVAEVNEQALRKRYEQGWVDEVIADIPQLVARVQRAKAYHEVVSIAYHGNVVEVWEAFDREGVYVDLGSDQTSLHNPWAGGYYPVGTPFEEANHLMAAEPARFIERVQAALRRHVAAINRHVARGTYFFDYGNAFLLEASRAGADIMAPNQIDFRYPSYVQDIMGPMCFDYGFGPFRWVCTSGLPQDLDHTDSLALHTLQEMLKVAHPDIRHQLNDNIRWIAEAKKNNLVVGSKARILYADAEGRVKIAQAFNQAVRRGDVGPVVLGRDHHDVSGTDSPYRETSNIYDGSRFTADMAIHNVIGDSFRGASWVSIHNGGGVGWGEVINGGFGLLLDGSHEADRRLESMLNFDVYNGIARRAWGRSEASIKTIERQMRDSRVMQVTVPHLVSDELLNKLVG